MLSDLAMSQLGIAVLGGLGTIALAWAFTAVISFFTE